MSQSRSKSELTLAERGLLSAFAAGRAWSPRQWREAQLREHGSDAVADDAPMARGDNADDLRPVIHADVLRALIIVDGCLARGIDPPAKELKLLPFDKDQLVQLDVRGLEIERDDGPVEERIRTRVLCDIGPNGAVFDLAGVHFPKRLACWDCDFEGPDGERAIIHLDDAKIGSILLNGSIFDQLDADQLRIDGDLDAVGVEATCFNLRGARIGGWVQISESKLENPDGKTFVGDSALVAGDLLAIGGLKSHGEFNFSGIRIGGAAWFSKSEFKRGKRDCALNGEAVRIDGTLGLSGGFKATGNVNLNFATIGEHLNCSEGEFDGAGETALNCQRIDIGGTVWFSDKTSAIGGMDFYSAKIGGEIRADGARFNSGSAKTALGFGGAQIGSHVLIKQDVKSVGTIDFNYATIGGSFEVFDVMVNRPDQPSAEPEDAQESDELDEKRSDPEGLDAEVEGAEADDTEADGGESGADEAEDEPKPFCALNLLNVTITQNLFLSTDTKLYGYVDLRKAEIAGDAIWDGLCVDAVRDGLAISAQNAVIGGQLKAHSLKSIGSIYLIGASIGARVSFSDCSIESGGTSAALNLRTATVAAYLAIDSDTKIIGGLDIGYASLAVGGEILATTIEKGESASAINAYGLQSGGRFAIGSNARCTGRVVLSQSRIGGMLEFSSAHLDADGDEACLTAHSISVTNSFAFTHSNAKGLVDLTGLTADDEVSFVGSKFEPADGKFGAAKPVLCLQSARIGGALIFRHPTSKVAQFAKIKGMLDLSHARCEVLDDAPVQGGGGANWLQGRITLDGFVYERFGIRAPRGTSDRQRWLQKQRWRDRWFGGFKAQPYEQASKVLREMGHVAAARSIAVSKQWRMHQSGNLSILAYIFRWLVMWPTGYGYRPQYPFLAGILIVALSYGVFEAAYRNGYMEPAQPHLAIAEIERSLDALNPDIALEAPPDCAQFERSEVVPPFNGLIYAIDTFVPLIDLDQESSWKPAINSRPCLDGIDEINPPPGWWTAGEWPRETLSAYVERTAPERRLYWIKWLVMTAGFAISALIAASLSGLLRRD